MKCFYDSTQDAVGTCKSCGRGLSPDHLTDMGKGLACRDRCEADVRSLITLIDQNISNSTTTSQILKRGTAAGYVTGVFLMLMGTVFLATSYRDSDMSLIYYVGVGILVYGLWTLFRSYRYASIVAKLPDTDDK